MDFKASDLASIFCIIRLPNKNISFLSNINDAQPVLSLCRRFVSFHGDSFSKGHIHLRTRRNSKDLPRLLKVWHYPSRKNWESNVRYGLQCRSARQVSLLICLIISRLILITVFAAIYFALSLSALLLSVFPLLAFPLSAFPP